MGLNDIEITVRDPSNGDEEKTTISRRQFVVICGEDRYVHSETIHANGTTVVTIKTDKRDDPS